MTSSRVSGTVRIVGSGLLGGSIGLGLTAKGVDVVLADASPSNLRLAIDYGAGRAASAPSTADHPALIVVATPPDVVADVVAAELALFPDAVVTDVASVKAAPLAALRAKGVDLARYVGSHPLAGRERGGAISARADLFIGRPWVVSARAENPRDAVQAVEDLARDLDANIVAMDPETHDAAVALVSHAPQVISTLLARRLLDGSDAALALAGAGLRDTTRIAGSQPELWVQILSANAAAVAPILRAYSVDLDRIAAVLEAVDAPGSHLALAELLASGNAGVARIPGKHGHDQRFTSLVVLLADRPGQLGRLFAHLGELEVNVEDLRFEHSPGAEVGLAEIFVVPESRERAIVGLTDLGWTISG